MTIKNKKIGIWGLGISGKAVLNYLKKVDCTVNILNSQPTDIPVIIDSPQNRKQFLESNDIIIPSPGINLRDYENFAHKFLPETDLFHAAWQKPIVAITGTLGKTTTTHCLSELLKTVTSVATGGNIGTGMMDLIDNEAELAVLELSSFQLEPCKNFAPDLAIWTNFHANHLDRHGTEQQYFESKKKILTHARQALLPIELISKLREEEQFNRPYALFSESKPDATNLKPEDIVYYFDEHNNIIKNSGEVIVLHKYIPQISFKINWLIIAAALDLLGYNAQKIMKHARTIILPGNRLELVATINDATYYNDSKSTLMHATLAAVSSLARQPITLLLGGTSKGVDRTQDIKKLTGKVHKVICFGAEAQQLAQTCEANNISTEKHKTLESAVNSAQKNAPPKSVVLLSPGGASFDLFKNYIERGEKFKQLVLTLKQSH